VVIKILKYIFNIFKYLKKEFPGGGGKREGAGGGKGEGGGRGEK
jgi:hypothetical protein